MASDDTRICDSTTLSTATTGDAAQLDPVSPNGPPCLIVTGAPSADLIGRVFDLACGQDFVIGRGRDASFQVDDPGVSRHHVRVSQSKIGRCFLSDLGSSNGAYVNGRRVSQAVLLEGDRVQLGTATVLRYSARRRLDEKEERQRQALAASGVGTWEWDIATCRLSFTGGPRRLATLGRGDAWLAVHPDDRQPLRDGLTRAALDGGTADLECRLLGEGNRACWVNLRGEALRDESGAPVRLAGALVDVNTHKLAEQEMHRQALMFASLSDAILVIDLAGSILDWNPAAERLFGHSKADAIGRDPAKMLEPGEPMTFLATAQEVIAKEGRWKGERKLWRKNGTACQVEMEVIPVHDVLGRHLANLAVCRDLDVQRRTQAQLLLADRLSALGLLAAGVGHEIGNPLSAIGGNLGCLEGMLERSLGMSGGANLDEIRAMLADMREGVERISLVVRELKTYCRGAGNQGQPMATVDRAVDYALRIVKSQVSGRCQVVRELGDVPAVGIAEPQLGQVLVNLLINAAHAIDSGAARKEIRVSTSWDEKAHVVVLRVTDTGSGIPAAVLPRIFDPFFTTKPVGIGTGLGLYVCRNLVESEGGTIEVESRPGLGTTFTISLPPAASLPAVEGDGAPPARSSPAGRAVLAPELPPAGERLAGPRMAVVRI